jgi:hypothetical protein
MTSSRPSNTARVLSVTGSAVVGLAALALLAVGALSLWGNAQKDRDGYVHTDRERVATTSYALATDDLDINGGGPSWLLDSDDYGKVRLSAESRDGKPVFIGVAHTRDVERYLGDTAHATVTDFDTSPFKVEKDEQPGGRAPVPPAESSIWAASSHGAGTQRLDWDIAEGNWSVVVMNADGSRGVDTTVRAGAKLGFLAPLGWGSIGGGVLLLVAAGGLLYLGVRAPRVPPAQTGATHAIA